MEAEPAGEAAKPPSATATATPPTAEGAPAAPPREARLKCLAAVLSAGPEPGATPGPTSGVPGPLTNGAPGASLMEVDSGGGGVGSGSRDGLPAAVVVEYEARVRGLLTESLAETQGWTGELASAPLPYLARTECNMQLKCIQSMCVHEKRVLCMYV